MSDHTQEQHSPKFQLSFPKDLIDTPYVEQIVQQSISYIQSGLFIHFQGKANTGKTTFARYVACLLQQPVVSVNSQILNDETIGLIWQAATQGYTLIFDECQRASHIDFQILSAILEEHFLQFPLATLSGKTSHAIHPRFVAIFTSNPFDTNPLNISVKQLDNYAVKIPLQGFDEFTENAIYKAKTYIDPHSSQILTYLLRQLRTQENYSGSASIKLGIMLGRILVAQDISVQHSPAEFLQLCEKILSIPGQPASREIVNTFAEQALTQFATIENVATKEDESQTEEIPKEETPKKETPEIPSEINNNEVSIHSNRQQPDNDITLMLHSEVELEMQFFDEVISYMQNISNEMAEVSFHHCGDAVQPDIMVKIAEHHLPKVIAFIEQQIANKVVLKKNHQHEYYECDVLIQVPAQVSPFQENNTEKMSPNPPTSAPLTQPNQNGQHEKKANNGKALNTDQIRIQKLKKLIANYEKFHAQ